MSTPDDSDRPGAGPAAGLSPYDANQLWETFCAGGNPAAREALDRLYRALRQPLVEFCRLKGCDAELADEVAESSFIRLIVRKPAARSGFIPLLQKTAQNQCHDAKKQRHRSLSRDTAPDSAHDPARSDTIPERSDTIRAPSASAGSAHNETTRAVHDCLNTLDPQDRALVIYHHVAGLTQRAASELLGLNISAPAVTARLKRAREQLARCLKKKSIF
ncbi:MAG: RNA polymerase sigma factor [Phycisphaerae bacterium]